MKYLLVRLSRLNVEKQMKFRRNLIAAVGQISHSFPVLQLTHFKNSGTFFNGTYMETSHYRRHVFNLRRQERNVQLLLCRIIFGNPITSETIPCSDIFSSTSPHFRPLLRPSHGLHVACRTLTCKKEMQTKAKMSCLLWNFSNIFNGLDFIKF